MIRTSVKFAQKAAMLPLVLLGLSLHSQMASAQSTPAHQISGTDIKLYNQSRAAEVNKAIAYARTAIGNCDSTAFDDASKWLTRLRVKAAYEGTGSGAFSTAGAVTILIDPDNADSKALENLKSQLDKEWSDAQPCGPSEPALSVTAGAFTGQLDRKSTGMLGTDLAMVISSANLVYLDNDTDTDGQSATAAFNTTSLDNQLWGDWFTIDPATSFSTGFSAVHVESNAEQRIDRIPVGAGNNLLIFSPEGQGGGLVGGLNAGARDAENVLYSNTYENHNFELKKEVSFDTSIGRLSPNLTFGYGNTDITERFSGQVAGINQDFAYHNMLDIDTYSVGFGVSMEAPFGKFASYPVEIYVGASATANFNDHSGHSKLDLSGIVNATEMKSFSGSETTGAFEANVGLSFEINDALEFVVGARVKSFDVGGVVIAPEQEARVNYDDATETLIFAAIKAGFGKGDTNLFGLSDRRLKRDIVHLTALDNGLKLYAFKYLWSDQIHVGVMAQDLLSHETYRHAVVMRPNGFYAVNYAMLGLNMATLEEWNEAGLASVRLTSASGMGLKTLTANARQ